jgi:Ca2+-binding EF-hand superfamily protein
MFNRVFLATIVCVMGSVLVAQGDDGPSADDLFKKLDTNGDGVLTASEIPKAHAKFFERLVRIGDADKDGKLTREEFDRAATRKEAPVTDISKTAIVGGGEGKRPNFDPKRIFENLDKNKDGKITREEAQGRPRIEGLFDRLGKDELTLADFSSLGGKKGKGAKNKGKAKKGTALSEISEGSREPGFGAHQMPRFLTLLDVNHDGQITREELSNANAVFDQLDHNKDGVLDAKELTGATAGRRQMADAPTADSQVTKAAKSSKNGAGKGKGKQGFQRLLTMSDTNGDGKLSEDEAPPRLKQHFAQIDKNGDGYLEPGEIQAALKSMRKNKKSGTPPESEKPQTESTPKKAGI